MDRTHIDVDKNEVTLKIDVQTYTLEAIYGAAYVFLDTTYVFLDKDTAGDIIIVLKPKTILTKKGLENLSGEFSNQLLNYSLRESIAKDNQKIREYIVGRALVGAIGEDPLADESAGIGTNSDEDTGEWKGDDLGIAIPWEEKFSPKKISKKKPNKIAKK